MIAAIRIKGLVDIPRDSKRTMDLLGIRKKYSCILLQETPEIKGMLKKVGGYIAYGEANKETIKNLIMKRGRMQGDKPIKADEEKIEKITEDLLSNKINLKNLKIKPFFRLHPPRGGFKKSTRLMYPKGILGKNDKINEIIMRML